MDPVVNKADQQSAGSVPVEGPAADGQQSAQQYSLFPQQAVDQRQIQFGQQQQPGAASLLSGVGVIGGEMSNMPQQQQQYMMPKGVGRGSGLLPGQARLPGPVMPGPGNYAAFWGVQPQPGNESAYSSGNSHMVLPTFAAMQQPGQQLQQLTEEQQKIALALQAYRMEQARLEQQQQQQPFPHVGMNPGQQFPPYGSLQVSASSDEKWFQVGDSRFVVVKIYKGRLYVAIRQYLLERGQWRVTRNGINLGGTEWQMFMSQLPQINEAVTELARHKAQQQQ